MSRLSWRWLIAFRLVLLPATLGLANRLPAADLVSSPSRSQVTATARLEYQETGDSVVNWSVSIASQSQPFKKEPAGASGRIIRGVLNFGGKPGNSMPFLWQRDAGKLFLDLNHNQDLSDDPAGIFSAHVERSVSFQTFTDVHLPLNTARGRGQVLVDINFWDYGSWPGGSLAVRSFWQGKVTLAGQDWQVGIIPNLQSQAGSFENGQLLLRPWERRNQTFNASGSSSDTVPFARKLFIGGHAYQLDWLAGSTDSEVKPALQFAEQSVALGEVKITGQFIRRLVLPGGSYLVVLDQPTNSVKVPTGSYHEPTVQLKQDGTEAFGNSGQWPSGKQISVDDRTPTVLAAGGPLTNTVTATRHGRDLRLDYRLMGAGGETYQLVNQNRALPPAFAIYQGDRKITSGTFEFG